MPQPLILPPQKFNLVLCEEKEFRRTGAASSHGVYFEMLKQLRVSVSLADFLHKADSQNITLKLTIY